MRGAENVSALNAWQQVQEWTGWQVQHSGWELHECLLPAASVFCVLVCDAAELTATETASWTWGRCCHKRPSPPAGRGWENAEAARGQPVLCPCQTMGRTVTWDGSKVKSAANELAGLCEVRNGQ